MFCPPGYRRFEELIPLFYEFAHKDLEAGLYRPDESAKGTPLYFGYPAAMLHANRLVDIIVLDGRLDTHLCSTSGTVLRVDGRQLLAMKQWVPLASDLEYWRRRNERFEIFDLKSGLIRLDGPGIPPGSPKDDPKAPVTPAMRRPFEEFEGWSVCFPCDAFPSSVKEIHDAIDFYSEQLLEPDSETRTGRPSNWPRIAEAYLDLFPDGHEAVGDSWKLALAKVSERLGYDFHVDTLKRALGRKS